MTENKLKWKYEILSHLVDTGINERSQDLERVKNQFYEFERFMLRTRNEILVALGFIITFLLALIQLNILPEVYFLFTIFIAMVGLAVFTIFSELLMKKLKTYRKLWRMYDDVIYHELFFFLSMIVSRAMQDELEEKDIVEYAEVLSILSFAQSYCMQAYAYKNLKHPKPSSKEVEYQYQLSKKIIPVLNKLKLESLHKRFKMFVHEYDEISKL